MHGHGGQVDHEISFLSVTSLNCHYVQVLDGLIRADHIAGHFNGKDIRNIRVKDLSGQHPGIGTGDNGGYRVLAGEPFVSFSRTDRPFLNALNIGFIIYS